MGTSNERRQAIILQEYEKIEESLRAISKVQGREGLLTDYIILTAVQSIDDDGIVLTNTGWHTNPKNGVPYHRMIGLVEYARAMLIKEATEEEDESGGPT